MTNFVTQDKVILYVQPDGANTAAKPLSIDKNGMADKTQPTAGRTVTWGTDAFGRFVPKLTFLAPPGGLNTSTVEEDDTGVFTFLKKMYDRTGCFPLQERWYKCGRKDGPTWTRVLQYGKMTITQKVGSAGPSREATGASMFNSYEVSWSYTAELYEHVLSSLTISEDQAINDITFLSDLVVGCNDCFPGYAPDEIGYLAVSANAGSPGDFANVWYTVNGGGTWAATSTNPFAALEDILFVEAWIDTADGFSVIVVKSGTSGQVKKSAFDFGAEGTSSWGSAVTIGSATVTAFRWLFYDRIYAASAGDIYVSTDQGDSFGAAVFTSAGVLNAFAKDPSSDAVYAAGNSDLIVRELNQSDTFDTLVGPGSGSNFTKGLAVANDGRIYAGYGTSIYLSDNAAANTGGWSQLKDFGANKSVVHIDCAGGTKSGGGDSQLLRVVVDDTAGGTGAEWESVDGGTTWRQVTALTNTGYNCAYFSPIDDNLAFIGGDGGVLQKLQAKQV